MQPDHRTHLLSLHVVAGFLKNNSTYSTIHRDLHIRKGLPLCKAYIRKLTPETKTHKRYIKENISSFPNPLTYWKSAWKVSNYGLPKTLHLIDLSGEGYWGTLSIGPQRTCRVQKTPDLNSGSPDEHFGTPWSHIGPLFRSSNFSLVPSSNFGLLEE